MPNEISVEKAKELLDGAIAQAQELMKDPSKVLVLLEEFEKKLEDIPFAGDVIKQIKVMISMVKDFVTKKYTNVSPKVVATMVAAFFYVVRKKDLISDNIPVLGFADDIAVVVLALKFVEPELNAYAAWKANQ
ncbi:MAG: DUF1232 domain-containing protein [Erysipelotrichaceae bacterium]|nr:DUF1232 domain-containing protein [Erysipelotrichaceae bacterium]